MTVTVERTLNEWAKDKGAQRYGTSQGKTPRRGKPLINPSQVFNKESTLMGT